MAPHDNQSERSGDDAAGGGRDARPYVGILFECCGVYARVYRKAEQGFYHGRCPKCLRVVRLRVGKDGVTARLFRAS